MATAVKPSSSKALTEKDLSDIFQELIAIQAEWYNFGLMLNVPDSVLQSIKRDYPSSCKDCLREVIKYFLRNIPDPKWETIVQALRSRTVGHANLAKQLEDKKCCEEEHQPSVRELQQESKGRERDRRLKELENFVVQSKQKSVELEVRIAKMELRLEPCKILLIGEVGSGKTSLLNFIANAEIIQRVGDIMKAVKEYRPFNDVKLENATSKQKESKTTGAKVYRTKIMDLDVDVIDTPGFGDSRGMEQDKENVESIISTLRRESHINCICLIINGLKSRVSPTLKYVLSEITAILPRQVLNNIVVVFTNALEYLDVNFDVRILEEYFGQPVPVDHVLCLENPYCRFEKAKEKIGVLTEKWINDSLRRSLEDANHNMLKDAHGVISKCVPVYTDAFDELFKKKQAIERNVMKLLAEYYIQKQLDSKVSKVEKEVEAAARSKRLNRDYKYTQRVERWVQVKTDAPHTLCAAKNCYSNCHANCYLPKSMDKEVFRTCSSFGKDGMCKKCGHSYTLHYHNEVMHEKRTEDIEMIDIKTQKRFNDAKKVEERKCLLLNEIKKQKSLSTENRRRLSDELKENIFEFQQLSVNRKYIKLLENQLELINQRLEEEIGEAAKELQGVKQQIKDKLKVVQEAMIPST